MRVLPLSLPFLAVCTNNVLADFLGPSYPPPRDLSSNKSLVAEAWTNVSSTLDSLLNNTNSTSTPRGLSGLNDIAFSLGVFSLHDPGTDALQYHHTSPELANATQGTTKADGDSIFRVASVSKLFTVLAGLVELDPAAWDTPLTECVPELADFVRSTAGKDDPIYRTQWDKITVGALASQLGDAPRDPDWVASDILVAGADVVAKYGLPPFDQEDAIAILPCLPLPFPCDANTSVEGVEARPPAFLPWTTPAYSNNGFVMLGMALTNLTGKTLDQLYRETIFEPLGMTSSNSTTDNSVIDRLVMTSDNITATSLLTDGGISKSSGGILSTTNDLAKLGIAILNSTLLPDDQTRKWMKPDAHTANLLYSMGRPWEIYRYVWPSGVVTDIYTKLGDSGPFGGYLLLIPDFDAGFSVLATSSSPDRSNLTAILTDVILDRVVPALGAQAAAEAKDNYEGTYTSTAEGLNSSLTLTVDPSVTAAPGLIVTKFISNGTDLSALVPSLFGSRRLLPTVASPGKGQVAFRASISPSTRAVNTLPEYGHVGLIFGQYINNADWLNVDAATYGGVGLSLFVFDLDGQGRATVATPAAWRVGLERD